MNRVDPLSAVMIELDRPVDPRPEFAADLLQELLDELRPATPMTERPRERKRFAWFTSRPPRLRVVLIAIIAALILTGIAAATYVAVRAIQAAAPNRLLLVTLHGHVTVKRRLPVETLAAGSWTVRWQVHEAQLTVGQHFLSPSAKITGTTSAHGPRVSCRGTLAAGQTRFALTVTHKTSTGIVFTVSPSPFATAVSSTCKQGLSASHWPLHTPAQRRDWRLFNHAAFGFVLPGYTPAHNGGNSTGVMLTHGVRWFATLTVACAPYPSGCPAK